MMYRFEEVKRSRKVSMKCAAGCGRRVTRTISASETVNPFNLVSDGSRPKARDEVVESVRAGLDSKCAAANFVCAHCGDAAGLKP